MTIMLTWDVSRPESLKTEFRKIVNPQFQIIERSQGSSARNRSIITSEKIEIEIEIKIRIKMKIKIRIKIKIRETWQNKYATGICKDWLILELKKFLWRGRIVFKNVTFLEREQIITSRTI